jgi:hypothetical protein
MPLRASAIKPSAPDPLANLFARGRIDEAQYAAGRQFQKHFELADKRRPEQPDGLADDQVKAWQMLTRCYQTLGQDGSAIVCDVLIHGMSAGEVAKSRGKAGQDGGRFYRMRLQECLRTLAEVYGFAH